jgi:uncharacterized protein YjbI with pentapeptide repeats
LKRSASISPILRALNFGKAAGPTLKFPVAQLSNVIFTNCDLTSADFSGAKITSADLRGNTLVSLKGVAGLKGATINTEQLISLMPEFAAALGIEVNDG